MSKIDFALRSLRSLFAADTTTADGAFGRIGADICDTLLEIVNEAPHDEQAICECRDYLTALTTAADKAIAKNGCFVAVMSRDAADVVLAAVNGAAMVA